MIDLVHLQGALAVAAHGSFARAARALGISQPALSRQIAGLEANLGIALFDRNRTGTVPTVFGRLVLERAAILLRNSNARSACCVDSRRAHCTCVRVSTRHFFRSASQPAG